MASPDFQKIIQDFSSYYSVPLKKLTFSYNNKVPVAHFVNKNDVLGMRNIMSLVSAPQNPEYDVAVDQWVEFTITHMDNFDSASVLKDVNNYLADKVYFIGNELGPIDILMYYFIYNIVSNWSFQEKEQYIHLSRWFNFVQQNSNARLWRLVVPFSRMCLYS